MKERTRHQWNEKVRLFIGYNDKQKKCPLCPSGLEFNFCHWQICANGYSFQLAKLNLSSQFRTIVTEE